jgi:hypothetical protein
MFSSLPARIFLGIFVIIIIGIPVGAYFLSSQQEKEAETKSAPKPSPSAKTITQVPSPNPSSAAKQLGQSPTSSTKASPSATPSSAVGFGPTMDFKVTLEGRPATYQAAKVFLGIADGAATVKPTYLLIYSVDTSATGDYSGLSLAGLTAGTQYTAYIKGPAQLDSATTFTMASAVTKLNNALAIHLLSGDLNEDNVVNSADFSIASSSFGANENSSNWNALADFNRDGTINTIDISIIMKNFGKSGATGPVTSTPGGQATSSAQLNTPLGGPDEATVSLIRPSNPFGETKGHWLWIPEIE